MYSTYQLCEHLVKLNIKHEIYEIVHGITVDFNNIIEFCNSELLLKDNSVKVGFTKA